MEEKFIKLIERQIDRLQEEGFDLEAWKSGTIAVISRVFGEQDARIKQIDNLKIDYSSWALRDSNSKYNPVETCKKKGKSILETMIDEMSILGVPGTKDSNIQSLLTEEEKKMLSEESKEKKAKHFRSLKKDRLVEILLAAI